MTEKKQLSYSEELLKCADEDAKILESAISNYERDLERIMKSLQDSKDRLADVKLVIEKLKK